VADGIRHFTGLLAFVRFSIRPGCAGGALAIACVLGLHWNVRRPPVANGA
jgi:hypothetical protein